MAAPTAALHFDAAVLAQLQQRGVEMQLFVYDAPHAFFNDTRDVYSPKDAEVAWARAVAFMRQHLL